MKRSIFLVECTEVYRLAIVAVATRVAAVADRNSPVVTICCDGPDRGSSCPSTGSGIVELDCQIPRNAGATNEERFVADGMCAQVNPLKGPSGEGLAMRTITSLLTTALTVDRAVG